MENINNYLELIEIKIKDIFSRKEKEIISFDILDTNKSKEYKLLILKEKQKQMKIGEIWEEVFGNYEGFINLKTGHKTGLDIISYSKKISIELHLLTFKTPTKMI